MKIQSVTRKTKPIELDVLKNKRAIAFKKKKNLCSAFSLLLHRTRYGSEKVIIRGGGDGVNFFFFFFFIYTGFGPE